MDKLKELIAEMGVKFRLDMAVVDKLEETDTRLYALEENRKMKDQAVKSLESRYSEILMLYKQMRREFEKLAQIAYHD